ncbi:Bacillosamine/Legionaminic acid biosynthesis aminotransferase PglE [Methanosarcina horonobensis HB-1 = JCM 15518]|uniref:Bacillosamine/Legionaminic acid biosynthesis aminotransferase PglE n=1 Tax=Methanosarcina horonobensis HB-1 = JCM 15518 TaxID=1434110 RepID=A0A0E3SH26_9EURY|nr:DegT/DnrJ/EryC1/StrS aminotransferase family protein [Methanosarcina horonobensis]AKB79722.1 Bacillosamine/Legionaminic acid biosynthesis aminotransferase PglE [Methanosarcina horonobensis HB-1 = JCM 15518]
MRTEFLPYCQPSINDEEIESVLDSLRSGWLTMGPKTIEFENLIAKYTGAKHAIAVSSCTAALHLSLLACGIGKNDEVITTPYTFASTGNVIVQVGAKPVFVDVRKDTYNIDPEKIEDAITPNTKAIIPVHFAGQSCDMHEIMKIAEKNNLFVIEDAAHAIGSEYHGKKIGCIGDFTCFSFYPTKNMTTGEGGAITTNNDEFVDKLKSLRLHGISKDAWKRYSNQGNWYYEIEDCGWKYNMTDLQAALGIPQIKKLDTFCDIRKKYADIYTKSLCRIEGIITPYEDLDAKHVYHLYPLLLEKYNRAKFIEEMGKRNISCSVHFIPLHLHPFYKNQFGFKKGDFPNAEWLYEREVSLPLYPKMKIEDVRSVIEAVEDIIFS